MNFIRREYSFYERINNLMRLYDTIEEKKAFLLKRGIKSNHVEKDFLKVLYANSRH